MKLKLLQGVVIAGHPGLAVGDVFDFKGNEHELISVGYAEAYTDVERPAFVEEIHTREPEIERRDPVIERMPKRKGRL